MTYRYMIRTLDGRLLFEEANHAHQAIKQAGIDPAEVKRHMPIKCLDTIKTMSEETKERLRALNEQRRALRKVRSDRTPKAEGIGKESEDDVSKGALEALQDLREKDRPKAAKKSTKVKEKTDDLNWVKRGDTDQRVKEIIEANNKPGKPTAEAKKDEGDNVKTATKTKKAKKAAPKSGERKAVAKPIKEKIVKNETFSVPDKFVRKFDGKDHIVAKIATGWSIDDGKEHVETLREAMIAILKMHKKEVGHRAASYFFANVEAK